MNKEKDKDMLKNLEDKDTEKISGGKEVESKKYVGPTPEFVHPMVLEYGMPSPSLLLKKYGGPMPKVAYGMPEPKIDPKIFNPKSSGGDKDS